MPAAHPRDPRLAAIERNLIERATLVARSGVVTLVPVDDVLAFHSTFPLPWLNAVTGAPVEDVAVRTADLLDGYLGRGLPFSWWPTPSTTTPGLDDLLRSRGLTRTPNTGMYADLSSPAEPAALPDGLHVELGADAEAFGLALATGSDVSAEFGPLLAAVHRMFPPERMLRVVVRAGAAPDADPVACGALLVTGETAGVHTVAVRADQRRRGVGTALTRVLTNIGRFHGCTNSVLHADDDGLPLFERLGYARVCAMPHYAWYPPPSAAG